MIIGGMVNHSFGNEGRDNYGRNANPQLFKIKVIVVVFWVGNGIAGSDGLRGRDMIIKPAMFIVGDDQDAAVVLVGRNARAMGRRP